VAFLTDDELYTLTKRKQGAAQIRVLKRQGIAFKLDGNNSPVVSWAAVNAVSGKVAKKSGPNIGYFRNKRNGASSTQRPGAATPGVSVLPAPSKK
jgi:uncharacterized protein DUF4224